MRLTPGDYLRLARRLPPGEVLRKAWALALRAQHTVRLRWRDRLLSTYPADGDIPTAPLLELLHPVNFSSLQPLRESLLAAADRASAHRFDLLGSGLVVVRKGATAAGVEGHRSPGMPGPGPAANRANNGVATRLRSMISSAYVPLDWHADFKSGYHWSADTWYGLIRYAEWAGVDVKVPWELARCQHLPVLALAFGVLSPVDAEQRAVLQREVQDQILDFMSANPVRFGVNWCCTMDVAIRAANWALAYGLLRAGGAAVEPAFEREFKRALMAHGRHIVNNLEWFAGLRSNHYLSNVCGLLFVAATVPPQPETDAWLAVAVTELVREVRSQFHDDGANFEGSTFYHRLSAEMATFSLALARGVSHDRLDRALKSGLAGLRFEGPGPDPRSFVQTLEGAAGIPWRELADRVKGMRRFTEGVTRPDGDVVQVGDNDSGRFFNLSPAAGAAGSNHSHLVLAVNALLGDRAGTGSGDEMVISGLAGSPIEPSLGETPETTPQVPLAFPDFGLYIYHSQRIWCAFRCGSVGQRGNGGHAHNDQLSFELCVDGVALVTDPGTYLYTPFPERRNEMRSTAAHNTIVVAGLEQNGWLAGRLGLFSMNRVGSAEVLDCSPTRWVARHDGFGQECRRSVHWSDQGLEIDDTFDGPFALNLQFAPGSSVTLESPGCVYVSRHGCGARFRFELGRCLLTDGGYSPAYGRIEPAPRVRVEGLQGRVRWTVFPSDPDARSA
jgi:hypothetical protein